MLHIHLGERKRISLIWNIKFKDSFMRYVTVLRHCYWVRGQATPPSNHDMIDGEVGGSFHLKTSGHT